ncbi:hypothetical protein [Kribbella endophytica]
MIRNESAADLTGYRGPAFRGLSRGKDPHPGFSQLGVGSPECPSQIPWDELELPHKGSVANLCVSEVALPGNPITQFVYQGIPYGPGPIPDGSGTVDEEPAPDYNEHYDLGGITWQ